MASPMFNSYNKLLVANKEPDTRCTFCGGDCSRTTIRRGVTTTHTFNLPCSIGLINKILIIYKQNNKVILEKVFEEVQLAAFSESLIYYKLSESDTLRFKPDTSATVQMKAMLNDGSIIQSDIVNLTIEDTTITGHLSDDYVLYATVNDQKIEVNQDFRLISGSNALYRCKFSFDGSWAKYIKIAVFKSAQGTIINKLIIDGYCEIPWEVLKSPGDLVIGVIGEYNGIRKPTIWSNTINVPRGCVTAEYEPTKSIMEELSGLISNTTAIAKHAEEVAHSALSKVNNVISAQKELRADLDTVKNKTAEIIQAVNQQDDSINNLADNVNKLESNLDTEVRQINSNIKTVNANSVAATKVATEVSKELAKLRLDLSSEIKDLTDKAQQKLNAGEGILLKDGVISVDITWHEVKDKPVVTNINITDENETLTFKDN